jgi:lipoprotein-releasing system permease protein
MVKIVKITLFFVKNGFRISGKQGLKPDILVSFGGFLLSVAVLTAAIILLDGYQRTLKEGLLGVNAHIFVHSFTARNLDEEDISQLNEFADQRQEIETTAPVSMTQAMAIGRNSIKGVLVRSIEWQRDKLPINYHSSISEGVTALERVNDAVIGYELAKILQLNVGDQFKLISPANMRYTVFGVKTGELVVNIVGLARSGVYDTDSRTVYVNKEAFHALTSSDNGYGMFEIELKPEFVESADYLSYIWERELGFNYQISSWVEYNSNLFTMLVVQRWVIFIILSFIVLIASFGIIANTTTTILDKRREIGILKATGAANKILKLYFLGRTAVLSLIAIIAGMTAGFGLAVLMTKQTVLTLKGDVYFIENFTVYLNPMVLLLIFTVTFLIALIATLLALRKISQLTVIEIIRNC